MVSLTMMARLLEAVRPDARLILVGDPDQLASVEAGAVLADLVAGLTARAATGSCRRRQLRCGAARAGTCAAPTPTAPGESGHGRRWPRRGGAAPQDLAVRRRHRRSGRGGPGRRRRRRDRRAATGVRSRWRWSTPTIPGARSDVVAAADRRSRAAALAGRRANRRWPGWTITGCCARTAPARAGCRSGPGSIESWLAADA